jgi:hypothetical protein
MKNVTSRKHACACIYIYVVTLENPRILTLIKVSISWWFFVLFVSVFVAIFSSKTTTTSTDYTQSMNRAHLSHLHRCYHKMDCLEIVMKSLNRSCGSLYCFSMCCPVLWRRRNGGGGGQRKNINIQTTDHLTPANPGQQRSYRATLHYEIRTWSAAWLSM